ncbi:MAG TPA: glycosyltransferase [Chryseosolibacter sp.]|nr:glycosyltransferase [Chryseosolibacter sp.]
MKRVVVAVLDWGLGHATRSVPVIRELMRQGCEVFLAGSGESLALLRKEFPELRVLTLPAYAPRYPQSGTFMELSMALQLPRFIRAITAEHRALEKIVREEHIDCIISDNRYGCWSKKIRAVFITHQSNILMPRRFGFLAGAVRRINERLMSRFDECWIPDSPSDDSLTGELSTFGKSNVTVSVRRIGWLSRFEPRLTKGSDAIDVLAIFSGPEPQRTALENIILPQLKASSLDFRVVRGLPSVDSDTGDKRVVNFMTATDLQRAIESAALIIARSGYSTVMDMKALEKRVVFIPTPGQTEQEYLGKRLKEAGVAYCVSQDQFDLNAAIAESKKFSGFVSGGNNSLLIRAVEDLLHPRHEKATNESLA